MDGPIPAPVVDPLGEALHLLRMDGAFYCRSELRAPWGLELPALPGYLWFHVVTAGSMRLEAGDTVRTLGPGEVALVPRGEGHVRVAVRKGARRAKLRHRRKGDLHRFGARLPKHGRWKVAIRFEGSAGWADRRLAARTVRWR